MANFAVFREPKLFLRGGDCGDIVCGPIAGDGTAKQVLNKFGIGRVVMGAVEGDCGGYLIVRQVGLRRRRRGGRWRREIALQVLWRRERALLDDVRELVSQRTPAARRVWHVFAGSEHEVISNGIRTRADGISRLRGRGVVVNADVFK